VAERQTHQLEGLARAILWRFKSSLAHHKITRTELIASAGFFYGDFSNDVREICLITSKNRKTRFPISFLIRHREARNLRPSHSSGLGFTPTTVGYLRGAWNFVVAFGYSSFALGRAAQIHALGEDLCFTSFRFGF
jgi:hypothetical protein